MKRRKTLWQQLKLENANLQLTNIHGDNAFISVKIDNYGDAVLLESSDKNLKERFEKRWK